jgi:hypothetical protein
MRHDASIPSPVRAPGSSPGFLSNSHDVLGRPVRTPLVSTSIDTGATLHHLGSVILTCTIRVHICALSAGEYAGGQTERHPTDQISTIINCFSLRGSAGLSGCTALCGSELHRSEHEGDHLRSVYVT